MSVVQIIFNVGLVLSILVTSLQLIRRDEWWVRVSDFPHVQLTVLTGVCFMGVLIFNPFNGYVLLLIAHGLAAFGYQLHILIPYTPLKTKQVKDSKKNAEDQKISILESNVFMENRDYDKFLSVVKKYDPDVIITLETDANWENAIKEIKEIYPYHILKPMDNTYGMLLYSKLRISKSEIKYWVDDNIPSMDLTLLLSDGRKVDVFVIHPEPPSPTENDRSTERDAELILVGKEARSRENPVIVAGDLNDVAWSHTTRLFQRLSGLLDPRIGRGFYNTFHADYWFMRWPLDHVFHSKHFLVSRIERAPDIGSDHFPMFIELSLEPIKGHIKNNSPEKYDQADLQESAEKLDKLGIKE